MLVMTGHAKKLSDLGIVIPNRLGINRVLQSLPPSYKNFVMNYNMQNMNKEFPELFGMLKAAEIEIKKEHQVLMVNKTTSFKKQGKSKGKFKKGGKKAATPPMKPKNGPKPDADCYYCKEKGHWKRNCRSEERPCQKEERRSEGKIFVAKNGTFLEKEFLTKEVTGRKVELDEIEESLLVDQSSAVPENVPVPPTPTTEEANDNDHETSNETATEPRRSTRDRATPDWYDPCLNVMIVDNNDEDPATYEEAMMSPDSNKWQEAMKSEMGSMYDNKVWTLVDLPDSRKAVENKWIFKRKTDADVSWASSKQCTVAKSSTESEYIAASEASSEAVWMKRFIVELGVVPSALDPFVIYCDNMGAIANAQEPSAFLRKLPQYAPYIMRLICLKWEQANRGDRLEQCSPITLHKERSPAVKNHSIRRYGKNAPKDKEEADSEDSDFVPNFVKTKGLFAKLTSRLKKIFCFKEDLQRKDVQGPCRQ
ncbi:hypothetical protein QYE76_064069 [Lolium multiflorum]|uniref:CCHC-type domain-containing protein n=1 Tax=Lolium multiflorum TaxID=4521 RepID=A0AAD8W9P2_LOLMU|nr:hypothetical protein QYE76_064069 [Lolium multiflorum]